MEHEKLLKKITQILDNLNIQYFVIGGLAVAAWGRLRATFDIDMVIQLIEPQVGHLAKSLRELSRFSYIDEQMIKQAIQRKGEFNFIDGETGLKVDFWIAKKDEHTLLRLKRKIAKNIGNQKIYFISPEDLILSKLEFYKISESSRHLEDAESVLKISGEKLDMKYLNQWAEKLGVLEILNKLIKKT